MTIDWWVIQDLFWIRIWFHSSQEFIRRFLQCSTRGPISHNQTRCHSLWVHQVWMNIQKFCELRVLMHAMRSSMTFDWTQMKKQLDEVNRRKIQIRDKDNGMSDYRANILLAHKTTWSSAIEITYTPKPLLGVLYMWPGELLLCEAHTNLIAVVGANCSLISNSSMTTERDAFTSFANTHSFAVILSFLMCAKQYRIVCSPIFPKI